MAFRVLPWLGGAVLGALAMWLLWTPGVVEKVVPVPNEAAGPAPRINFEGNSGAVWALTFLDADNLVIGTENGQVKIWNSSTGETKRTLESRQGGTIWSADVTADGKYLVTPCDDSKVTVWDLEKYRPRYEFSQPTSTKAAVFSPDGHRLATGDRNATVRLWDLDAQIPIELYGHLGTVHALAYSPNGERLASAGSDGTVKVWDLRDIDWHRRENSLKPTNLVDHRGPVYGVTFCPKSELLATTGWDGSVRIYDGRTGVQKQTIKEAHDGDAWSVSFGNGCAWVASAGQDGVKVFEVETGKEIFSYRGGRAFHVVRFAKNGTTLAAGGRDGTVKVWELTK